MWVINADLQQALIHSDSLFLVFTRRILQTPCNSAVFSPAGAGHPNNFYPPVSGDNFSTMNIHLFGIGILIP